MTLVAIASAAVILIALAVSAEVERGPARTFAPLSVLPLVFTIVLPLPFALMEHRRGWPRSLAVAISWIGIAASCAMFILGLVLVVRAILQNRLRSALLLAIETFVAGLPAAMFGVYAMLFSR